MRAAVHAPRDPSRVLERRHDLAEIVERGGRVLAEQEYHGVVFCGLIENLAGAIFGNALAPRKDLVEATEILTKQLKRLRQVLGAAHPATQRHENHLKKLQERLAHLE